MHIIFLNHKVGKFSNIFMLIQHFFFQFYAHLFIHNYIGRWGQKKIPVKKVNFFIDDLCIFYVVQFFV